MALHGKAPYWIKNVGLPLNLGQLRTYDYRNFTLPTPSGHTPEIIKLDILARKQNNQWCAYKNPKKVKLEISTKHNEVIFWLEPG